MFTQQWIKSEAMFKKFTFLCLVVVTVFGLIAAYGETQLTVGTYKAKSGCKTPANPAVANVTYILNKCYDGIMYDCEAGGDVTYMVFPDLACGSKYPNTYGLPVNFCMSPVYAYSSDDTYMWCH